MKIMRLLSVVLMGFLTTQMVGCALVFHGESQSITIQTVPEGKKFKYNGVIYTAPAMITIDKAIRAPSVFTGPDYSRQVELSFNADVWLIGDSALLFVFVVPGLIAFGVDLGTGAWRQYDGAVLVPLSQDSRSSVGK